MTWRGRDVINILDFRRDDLDRLFSLTDQLVESDYRAPDLSGRSVALIFLEPSTRTMYSFYSAVNRLGGSVLPLSMAEATSIAKGESLADTIRMFDSYADLLIIRDKREGAAYYAAEVAESPVINAGDGAHNHPTQAMIDLYTINRLKGGIDGLTIGVLGDLKYGRAAASFILGLTLYRPGSIVLISPEELRLKSEVRDYLDSRGVEYVETSSLRDVVPDLDVLYVTRIQKERFPDPLEYERVRGSYRVDLEALRDAKEDLIILHPLPRVDEIAVEVDDTPYAKYFLQARYGVYIRMALLRLVMGV